MCQMSTCVSSRIPNWVSRDLVVHANVHKYVCTFRCPLFPGLSVQCFNMQCPKWATSHFHCMQWTTYVNTHCVYFLFAWNAFPVHTACNARTCKDIPNFGCICSGSSFCEQVNTCVVKHRILINLLHMCTFVCTYICTHVHMCICALFWKQTGLIPHSLVCSSLLTCIWWYYIYVYT